MMFFKLFYYFHYNLITKFGLNFDFFFFRKSLSNIRVYSYVFDIYSDITEDIMDLYTIIYDLTYSFRKPQLLKYKHIYRGKSRVKVLIIQSSLSKINSLSFNALLSEIFFFVLPRYFYSFLRKSYFTNLDTSFSFSSIFLNFTMSSFLFLYMLEDIDPVILRSLKVNFSIMFSFNSFFKLFIVKILYSLMAFVFFFKLFYNKT